MNAKRNATRGLAAGLLLSIAACIGACTPLSEKWGEEVLLSDGRVIVVEREIIMERGGDEWAHNRAGVKPREFRMRIPPLDGSGKPIEWKSVKKSPYNWPENALVFDVESGQPMIMTLVAVETGCEVYSQYRYLGGSWVEHPLPDKFEQRPTNLLIRSGTNMPEFVSLAEKRLANKDVSYRRAVKQVGPSRKVCG